MPKGFLEPVCSLRVKVSRSRVFHQGLRASKKNYAPHRVFGAHRGSREGSCPVDYGRVHRVRADGAPRYLWNPRPFTHIFWQLVVFRWLFRIRPSPVSALFSTHPVSIPALLAPCSSRVLSSVGPLLPTVPSFRLVQRAQLGKGITFRVRRKGSGTKVLYERCRKSIRTKGGGATLLGEQVDRSAAILGLRDWPIAST